MTNTNDPAYVSDDTGVVLGTLITDQPLESLAAAAYDDVMAASMGACVTFNGVVRNHDGGQRVRSLSYTSHPTAEAIMATVADKVLDRHPDVRIWAAHRIGAPGCRLSGMLGHGGHRQSRGAHLERTTPRIWRHTVGGVDIDALPASDIPCRFWRGQTTAAPELPRAYRRCGRTRFTRDAVPRRGRGWANHHCGR